MKVTLSLLTAAVAVAAANPHHQHHQHRHAKRVAVADADQATNVQVVPGPTVVAYVLNGQPISAADVERGIANGTLIYADDGSVSSVVLPTLAASTSTWVAPSTVAPTTTAAPTTSQAPPPSSSQAAPAPSAPAVKAQAAYSGSTDSDFSSDEAPGLDDDFPNDGSISCSDFPSAYGAVPVSWTGLGGWTGVQKPPSWNIMNDIETMVAGSAGCSPGTFCSYACPAGWQKTQWPELQGATGQSIGGLKCNDQGKLELTNTAYGNKLCMKGAQQVTVLVKNTMSQNVAVCRTDYPGTEGETVPLNAVAGSTTNLTCPDGANYYTWGKLPTSAQYYVNPAGVSVQDACQWGSPSNPWGNYAPMNIGVGWSNGAAWLSIFGNAPTTTAQLKYTVELQGDGMSGTCKYSNGEYCSGANYENCSPTKGCTVSFCQRCTTTE